jgi:hypothetical protein
MDINIDSTSYDHLNSTEVNKGVQSSCISSASTSSTPTSFSIFQRIPLLFPPLPYSAKYVRQDQVTNIAGAITKTETQRLLGLRGNDGLFACRIADGWSTSPIQNEDGRIFLASRSILRLNNITIFRNNPATTNDYNLANSMIGPNHYFGVLDNTHKYCCTLQYSNKGIPVFVKQQTSTEQKLATNRIPDHYIKTIDTVQWISGKEQKNNGLFNKYEKKISKEQALTKDLGKVILDIQQSELILPKFDACLFDLSPFGARLVTNNQPFKITHAEEDPMDVVTYHFGRNYAATAVQKGMGLFLETHNFTQIMSPMTKDSGGFICLARWQEKQLQLIGVEVPYGYSIIVDKGTIHGDATFIGSYLMAMTVNHKTMATADVVFLRNTNEEKLMLKLENNNIKTRDLFATDISYNDTNLRPLVIISEGKHKNNFDNIIKNNKKMLDDAVKTGSSIIYNPFNSAELKLKYMK